MNTLPPLQVPEEELISVLQASLYPGASANSIRLVVGYCKAAGLDPMQKPVHIVPMWDKTTKSMRDVVMPGIGIYRTQAARSGQYAGISEPEFGPVVTREIDGTQVSYPEWCRVTVKRLVSGTIVEFTAIEFWMENYATAGRDTSAPNTMWRKRPFGQIAKCAEAQALRKAFPEVGAQPTAEEMEGRLSDDDAIPGESVRVDEPRQRPQRKAIASQDGGDPGSQQEVQPGSVQQQDAAPQAPKKAETTTGGATVTDSMLRVLRTKLSGRGALDQVEPAFCTALGVDRLESIAVADVNAAIKKAGEFSL